MIRRPTFVVLFMGMVSVACAGGGAGEDRASKSDGVDLAQQMAQKAGA